MPLAGWLPGWLPWLAPLAGSPGWFGGRVGQERAESGPERERAKGQSERASQGPERESRPRVRASHGPRARARERERAQ